MSLERIRTTESVPCRSSPLEESNQQLPKEYETFTDHRYERKLKKVKHLLSQVVEKDSLESLVMVDALQRLGIDYHFEEEIQSVLQAHHLISSSIGNDPDRGLYEVALRFRLLRQGGYNDVSADIFDGFTAEDGGFDVKLCSDIEGLASLYEASHVSIGEDILDVAKEFSRQALASALTMNSLSRHEAELVRSTLANPFHESLARFTCTSFRNYFKFTPYKWRKVLEELADLASERVAAINQMEMLQVAKWWRDLGLTKELKFVRHQPLKWYLWPMVVFTDPLFSEERVELTKPIAMVYIIDDIFDVHGTLQEVTLFTEAVNKWECMEELPDYMKTCFHALDSVTNDVSCKIYEKHGWDPTDLLRTLWANLCDAFLEEARWFASGQMPESTEYLMNATVSSGAHLALVHAHVLLGGSIEEKIIDHLNSFPSLLFSTAKIVRLWDDLGSAMDENQEGYDGSYVAYYMNENPSCSLVQARDHVKVMISEAWKSLNKGCLFPHPLSSSFAAISLNSARMVPLMYDYDNDHNLPCLEEYMKSLLLHKV